MYTFFENADYPSLSANKDVENYSADHIKTESGFYDLYLVISID